MRFSVILLTLALFVPCLAFAQEPEWNQWRGPNNDGKSFSQGLLKSWPKEGPKLLWKVDTLGEGYSNLAFFGDKIFTTGDKNGECVLIALDREDGEIVWETPFAEPGELGSFAGPKGTPCTDGKTVFALGQFGDFIAADFETGEQRWCWNVYDELDAKIGSIWGYATSPILDGDKLILTIGGNKGMLAALNKDTGEVIWQSKELPEPCAYASAVPVDIDGVHQYITFNTVSVAGIDANDGSLLWQVSRPGDAAVCSDPLYKDGIVFISSAYGVGANAYEVKKNGDKFEAKEIYADKRLENQHGGCILVGDYVYMLTNTEFACVDLKTGKTLYKNRSVGKGALGYADGHLILRSELRDGTIALVEANPKEYKEICRFDQPDRSKKNGWTYPLVIDGKLYLRDQELLLCYDLNAEK